MAKSGRNAAYTKDYNRKSFLRLLRTEPLSRSEVARRIGLTRAATSLIAEELISEGYIKETIRSDKPLGRIPVPLQLVGSSAYAVGIYLHRDACRVSIVDLQENVLAQTALTNITPGNIDSLCTAIRDLIGACQIPKEKVVGVGISAPGPLDGKAGRILNPPGFEEWHHVDIGPMLSETLGLPVFLENDASCLARYNLGKPETRGSSNYLLLLVDNGIGSGVIINGKVLTGSGCLTSELGHTTINYCGRKCACGNSGCLETYASINNLLEGSVFTSWQEIIDCCKTNPMAQRLLLKEVDYLAAGIVNFTNMISIDTVLLAGELLYGYETIAPLLEKQINSKTIHKDALSIRVAPSVSEPDSPILSAADIAFGHFLMA